MTLDEFVKAFAAELEETPEDVITPATEYKTLDEWGSLCALSIIAMVDENFDKSITGADLRSVNTVEELYNLVLAK